MIQGSLISFKAYGCFHTFEIPFVGVFNMRALLFGVKFGPLIFGSSDISQEGISGILGPRHALAALKALPCSQLAWKLLKVPV